MAATDQNIDSLNNQTGNPDLILDQEIELLKKRITELEKENSTLRLENDEASLELLKGKLFEERYKAVLDCVPGAILISVPGVSIIETNVVAQELFGYSPEEFKAKNRYDILVNDQALQKFLIEREKKEVAIAELTGIRKNGEKFPVHFISKSFINPVTNKRLNLSFVAELTQQKKFSEFLNDTTKIAKVGGWDFNLTNNKLSWTAFTRKIFEVPDDFEPNLENALGFYPQVWREQIEKTLQEAQETGRESELDLIVVTAKNKEKWVKVRAKAEFDGSQCIRIFGIIQDIDIAKRLEIKEVIQRNNLKALIENMPYNIYSVNMNLDFILFNPAFKKSVEEFTGRELGVGMNLKDFKEMLVPEDYEKITTNGLNGTRILFENHYPSNGKDYYFEISINPIYNDDNQQLGFSVFSRDITLRKETELAIKKSNERFELVTKASFDAIWDTDFLTNTVYFGEGFFTLFGYSTEFLQTKEKGFFEFLHPKDAERVKKSYQKALQEEKQDFWIEEYRFLKADGHFAYVLDKALIIRDENGKAIRVTGAMQDISQQKREELQLRLLESAITHSSDGIVIAEVHPPDNQSQKMVFANKAYMEMMGLQKDDWLGKRHVFLQGENTNEEDIARLNNSFYEKRAIELETIAYTKEGSEFWLFLSAIPVLNSKGKASHWIFILRDTTDRKRKEIEREELVKELTKTNQELKQFSFITSHNLRSSVSNMIAISNLIDESKLEDELTKDLINGLKTTSHNLNDTLSDLINVLVIKENKDIEQSDVHFADIYNKVATGLSQVIEDNKVLIYPQFSDAPKVRFNQTYMESIFMNMITNAIKYSKADRKPIVFIYSYVKDNQVVLVFEDNGLGMNMNKVKNKIFGLYQRFHRHADSKGIGLYMVHSQVTSLGGTIEVESEENEGTKFIISFKNGKAL
jgi:PAS domain S-box-containing protein